MAVFAPASSLHPRPRTTVMASAISVFAHAVLLLLVVFDVAGIGGGFGIGVGPGFGVGAGGGAGLGEPQRREIFSLEDLPNLVRPRDPDEALQALLAPRDAERVVVPAPAKPQTATAPPVVAFARP